MDDQYQFETAEEYKQDIRECSDPNDNDEIINSIFQETIQKASDLYYLVNQKDFFVMNKTDCDDGTYKCEIECHRHNFTFATRKVRRILNNYVECQDVQVVQNPITGKFLVSQIPERSYLYLALFKGTVVKWVYRLQKLIM